METLVDSAEIHFLFVALFFMVEYAVVDLGMGSLLYVCLYAMYMYMKVKSTKRELIILNL